MQGSGNTQVVLLKKPGSTYPEVNDVFEVQKMPHKPINLAEGGVLVETLYLSIDAAMRVWITGVKTYFDPVLPGDIMPALGVGRVLDSKSKKFNKGDMVSGLLKWQQFVVVSDKQIKKIETRTNTETDLLSNLGPLGISGLTAYTGFEHIGKPKAGEVIVVSAAAGAVGELAIQLAKNHYKCTVIGIAGGEDKCKYVTEQLGADACINYKKDDVEKKLKELCPNGIDIYFDNVGGEQLDAALMNIRDKSRIILCGAVSQYSKKREDLYRIRNYPRLIIKQALMQGFIYTDFHKSFPAGVKIMDDLMQQGRFKVRYDIQNGLDQASVGLQKLLLGSNVGKVIVRVSENSAPRL